MRKLISESKLTFYHKLIIYVWKLVSVDSGTTTMFKDIIVSNLNQSGLDFTERLVFQNTLFHDSGIKLRVVNIFKKHFWFGLQF